MKLNYNQIVSMCATSYDSAAEAFGAESDCLNWNSLVEAMLVLQQVRQVPQTQREAFEEYLAGVPLREWGEAIVKRMTGRSIAEALKAYS